MKTICRASGKRQVKLSERFDRNLRPKACRARRGEGFSSDSATTTSSKSPKTHEPVGDRHADDVDDKLDREGLASGVVRREFLRDAARAGLETRTAGEEQAGEDARSRGWARCS